MSLVNENRHQLRARPVRFDWKHTPLHWIPGHAFVTHFINVLHLLLPEGELWFCRVYNKALPLISDDDLRNDVKGFIRQEAIHSRSHDGVLEHYYKAHGIDTTPYTRIVRWLFTRLLSDAPFGKPLNIGWLDHIWLVFRLGLIAAIEHFTCIIGKWVIEAKALDEAGADPEMLDLLRWHGAEEVEHRNVAHDLFMHLGGNYLYRLILMIIALPVLLGLWIAGTRYFLARDPGVSKKPFVFLAWHHAAGQGLLPGLGWLALATLRYLKPGYHPEGEADTAMALAYLETSPAALAARARTRAPS